MGELIHKVRIYSTDRGLVVTDHKNNILYQSVNRDDDSYDRLDLDIGWLGPDNTSEKARTVQTFGPGTSAMLVHVYSEESAQACRMGDVKEEEGEMRIRQYGTPIEIHDVKMLAYSLFQLASERLEKRLAEYEGSVATIDQNFNKNMETLDREYARKKKILEKRNKKEKEKLGEEPTLDDFI